MKIMGEQFETSIDPAAEFRFYRNIVLVTGLILLMMTIGVIAMPAKEKWSPSGVVQRSVLADRIEYWKNYQKDSRGAAPVGAGSEQRKTITIYRGTPEAPKAPQAATRTRTVTATKGSAPPAISSAAVVGFGARKSFLDTNLRHRTRSAKDGRFGGRSSFRMSAVQARRAPKTAVAGKNLRNIFHNLRFAKAKRKLGEEFRQRRLASARQTLRENRSGSSFFLSKRLQFNVR